MPESERVLSWFSHLPDAYLVTDAAGKFLAVNQAAARLLRCESVEIQGRALTDFLAPVERTVLTARLTEAQQRVTPGSCRFMLQPAAAVDSVLASLHAILPVAAAGSAVDLLWRLWRVPEERQDEVWEWTRLLITHLGHEGRNELQRVQSALERLSWRLAEQPEMQTLILQAQSAQQEVGRLLETARLYVSPVSLERSWYKPADSWRAAWSALQHGYPQRDCQLRETGTGADLFCMLDAARIRQVFQYLFEFALARCPEPLRVQILAPSPPREASAVQIQVSASGPEVPLQEREAFFDPFYPCRPRRHVLGLAVAVQILKAHGGSLELGPDPRLTFVLHLPRGG